MGRNILKSEVNGLLSLVCVGTVALGAWLVVWQIAFGENPLANAMAEQMSAQYRSY